MLTELLIVLMIVGIVSAVTMVAVLHVSARGADSVCSADRKHLEAAVDSYPTIARTSLSENVLVRSGYLLGPSENFDVAPDGTVVPQADAAGRCS